MVYRPGKFLNADLDKASEPTDTTDACQPRHSFMRAKAS
jgi:hypothetical protein